MSYTERRYLPDLDELRSNHVRMYFAKHVFMHDLVGIHSVRVYSDLQYFLLSE